MIFHLHGPLDPESPLFVGREEELARIERWLERGDAVGAVLGGRQNGKTSVLLRARERARPWQPVAFVDFQAVAGADPAACARHIAEQIADQLGGALAALPPIPESAGGLQAFLRAVASAARAPRLGLFLDELGVLSEETRRWLGSSLRASFNLRLVHRELGRWTFILAGGIELCDMAVHRNSPLRNVLDEIYLGDLSEGAVAALLAAAAAPGLPASRAAELRAWTAGQPYLTQALAEEVVRSGSIAEAAATLLCAETHNLPHVFHAIDREGLEPTFRRIVAQESVPFTRLDDDVARLELIGVLRDDTGLCRARNALYAEAGRRRYGLAAPAPAREPRLHADVAQAAAPVALVRAPERPIRILHLSDLHVRGDADPAALLQPLAADLEDRVDGLGIDHLDFLVVTGDVSNGAAPAELDRARELCASIITRFGLTAERCILVPGNHDVDWNEPVYRTVKKRSADPRGFVPGTFKEQGDLYEVRDDALYPNRWKSFSRCFYHPLLEQPYPLLPEQQGAAFLFPDAGLQFLALNSAWEIDEYFPARSGVHPGALARALDEADLQVRRAREAGCLAAGARVLRVAVWHHPVTGNEKMAEDAFMGSLQKAGVRLCLHGHVHEERADLLGYLHATRSVHVMGAGSFGAPGRDRPESTPRLYNVLEVSRDLAKVRVHTRCLRRQTGAWEGWAVWPGAGPGERRTYYEVALSDAPPDP